MDKNNVTQSIITGAIGAPHQRDLIHEHMNEYFTRFPSYKEKFTELEWYHIFLDFSDKIDPQIKELREENRKLKESLSTLQEDYNLMQTETHTIGTNILKKQFEVYTPHRKIVVEVPEITYEFDRAGYDIIEQPKF